MARRTPGPRRRLAFWVVLLLFPWILLATLELSLRAVRYGDELPLFVAAGPDFADEPHLLVHSRVAERYFDGSYSIPRPPADGFRLHKPANGYRIFVMGGSTTAGWPYPNNAMFSRFLQRRLAAALPDRHVEVVNLGIAASNSFTLLDFLDEVLDQQPDAILVYSGHNEFYGAFGVASTASAGRSPGLVRLYLRLQHVRIFQLLRDAARWTTTMFRGAPSASPASTRAATLMGQVIGDPAIPLDGEVYARGAQQFRDNIDRLLRRTKAAGVPTILSELVSNVRDHPPFLFHDDAAASPAAAAYREAQRLEADGRIPAAREKFYAAKDLDGLRFRAPERFNEILRELAASHDAPLVPMLTVFEAASPHGLIGDELMLEHLHPNARGYELMGHAFFDTLREHPLAGEIAEAEPAPQRPDPVSELDVAIGALRVLHLTDHWPYRPAGGFTDAFDRYVPQSRVEELAKAFLQGEMTFRAAHQNVAADLLNRGDREGALRQLRAMVASAPLDADGYLQAAEFLLRQGEVPGARAFAEDAVKIRSKGPGTERVLADLMAFYLNAGQLDEAHRVRTLLGANMGGRTIVVH